MRYLRYSNPVPFSESSIMRTVSILLLASLGLGLGACTTATPPVEVTRFHAEDGPPVARGTIAILASDSAIQDSLAHRTYATAVRRELQRIGYQPLDTGGDADADYAAFLTITRDRIEPLQGDSPVSVGVGGSTGSYGSGIGVGIGFNLGGGKDKGERIATELFVRITDRGTGLPVWEGRAMTEAKAGSPAAQPGMVSARLAEALFQDFPGQSGETIRVP